MKLLRNTRDPADALFPGWIDSPDAPAIMESLALDEWQLKALHDLHFDGFTVLRGVQDQATCEAVVEDYAQYSTENSSYVAQNCDDLGREKRLVNFHLWSDNELKLLTNNSIMSFVDLLFGERAYLYTSLTFKYGTQQPIHRDIPHFATWPGARFCGVWTALEDIHPDSGPLMYIRGGHRFEVDHLEIFRNLRRDHPEVPVAELAALALDIYNGRIIDESPNHGELVVQPIRKGDVVIWHPQSPHGGSPAANPYMSRWSVVAHCAPEATQVFQHQQFFSHDSNEPPPPRYGFREAYGRKVALAGETAFM